ncbi:LOW QUALITY PROTEIN: uncharacterized protein LOC110823898 [Carica papaya]|uniref:LOW QUALITY PROTEIN: uncharacterized protein LOC110823898 n=1 Tax=Carica papaya TaxID=3649 RepID=UPI000B8CA4EA|nr:LOW QUALITY PROTEIN: uncharacterized protein LOC110823898 [Carica papaya]
MEEEKEERRKPVAVFMAFGTKGDVYPIAAITASFARDQKQYDVILITHSAHETLSSHLAKEKAAYFPISSPPVLSPPGDIDTTDIHTFLILYLKIAMENLIVLLSMMTQEGWSLAEAFCIRCMVAAPYVVPYSAPSTFECKFRKELPELYQYLKQAPFDKVCWKDVIHWMWPLFTETFGSWRSGDLNLSSCPFMDPVTDLPTWHAMPQSPLLFYMLATARVQRFTHLFMHLVLDNTAHPFFHQLFCSMGFLRNPQAFLQVLQTVLEITSYRFILFTDGYGPLDAAIRIIATESSSNERKSTDAGISLFDDRLFCFSGMVPYTVLFPRCAAAIHHGGRLQVGIPQLSVAGYSLPTPCTRRNFKYQVDKSLRASWCIVLAISANLNFQIICPFMLDQFYWAEKMFWLGVAPEPVERNHLVPEKMNDSGIRKAAIVLSKAIHDALSPRIKACALRISERISCEDGVSEAVKLLREEICC